MHIEERKKKDDSYINEILRPVLCQVNVKIKIVSGSPCGAVAAEAKKTQSNWVVLDK